MITCVKWNMGAIILLFKMISITMRRENEADKSMKQSIVSGSCMPFTYIRRSGHNLSLFLTLHPGNCARPWCHMNMLEKYFQCISHWVFCRFNFHSLIFCPISASYHFTIMWDFTNFWLPWVWVIKFSKTNSASIESLFNQINTDHYFNIQLLWRSLWHSNLPFYWTNCLTTLRSKIIPFANFNSVVFVIFGLG